MGESIIDLAWECRCTGELTPEVIADCMKEARHQFLFWIYQPPVERQFMSDLESTGTAEMTLTYKAPNEHDNDDTRTMIVKATYAANELLFRADHTRVVTF